MGKYRIRIFLGAVAGVALLPHMGMPQTVEEDGGLVYTFGFSTEMRSSDNLQLASTSPGNSYLSETALSFGLASKTRNQSLDFRIGNRFQFTTGDGAPDNKPFLPNLLLDYSRENRNTRVSVDATLVTRDMSIDDVPIDITDPSELLTDSGTEYRQNVAVEFETGRAAPFGTQFRLFANDTRYIDATDPDLYDRSRVGGAANLLFRPDTATELGLRYYTETYEASDSDRTRRVSQSISLSAERDLNALTTVDGRFGWKTVDETLRAAGAGPGNDRDGYIASVGLSRDLPTGFVTAELSRDVTGAGDRSDFTLTRGFELPAGKLNLTVGVTEPEGDGYQPTGGLLYEHELSRQVISFNASTRIIVADDDTVQRASRIGLSYDILVNPTNIFGVAFNYNRTDNLAGGTDETSEVERSTATASYTRVLTKDWSLSTGYTHRFRQDGSNGSASANEIFVSLGREFAWRP